MICNPLPLPPPPMVDVEWLKIFDVQCIWGKIIVSLEKIFVFKYSYTIFHLVFTWNIYRKRITRTFLGAFFWAPIPFKRTKIRLDVALLSICVTKGNHHDRFLFHTKLVFIHFFLCCCCTISDKYGFQFHTQVGSLYLWTVK